MRSLLNDWPWSTGAFIGCLLIVLVGLTSCSPTTVQFRCPPLAPPPSSTIDALETQARKDPNTASWVIDLDKHYQKLDACK